MINEKYLHSELTGKIIGCAMEVHKTLGNGFMEPWERYIPIEAGCLTQNAFQIKSRAERVLRPACYFHL